MEGRCYVMGRVSGNNKLCLPEQWREREGPAQAASRDWSVVFGEKMR